MQGTKVLKCTANLVVFSLLQRIMRLIIKQLFFQSVFLFVSVAVFAQDGWPTPEVAQMYSHAGDYMAAGNFKDAIITYKQAIKLAPGKMVLYRGLGDALYRSGDYDGAEKILESVADRAGVDAECFRLLALAHVAKHENKHAIAALKNGLERFPSSGMLYHEKGSVYLLENKREEALSEWINGIEKEPGFSANYFDAATSYFSSNDVMWGIIYGEIFLTMQHDTARDDEMKNKLLIAYKAMFDGFAKGDVTKFSDPSKHAAVKDFEDAVKNIFESLTPVVSDGITTENLAMVRVRFLMEWGTTYSKKFPFPFFSYLDNVIRIGRFDVYNEWLFGKAESAAEFKAWNEFHEGDVSRFLEWQNVNKFVPSGSDFYNRRNMKNLFDKKK